VSNIDFTFSNFVKNVYHDLGNPPDYPLFRISGWFLDQANIGKLNNLIGTQISGVQYTGSLGEVTGYGLEPCTTNDQMAIYKMLFDYEYFKSSARSIAQSSVLGGNDWISLTEGDSSITRVNKNELSKNFRGLANDAKKDLDQAVKMYLKYNASPQQVAGDDIFGQSYYSNNEWARTTNLYNKWPL
jgi:hypothetical protein